MGVFKSMFRGRGQPRPDNKEAERASLVEAEAAKNRGNESLSRGDIDEAAACYLEAIRLHPGYAEAYNNLGYIRGQQKNYVEAETMLGLALSLNPDLGPAYFNLGVVSQERGRIDQAIDCFERSISLMPGHAEGHWRLGIILNDRGDSEAAIHAYRQAIAIDPGLAEVHINLGTAYKQLGRYNEAERHYRQALAINPHPVAADFLGILLQEQRQWDKASACYRQSCSINPDYFPAHWNLALLYLLRGDYGTGLDYFERRLYLADGRPAWATGAQALMSAFGIDRYWRRGENLEGKTLLVWTEQGLGDTLMTIRYLPLLAEKGIGDLTVHCEPALVRLFQGIPQVGRVIPKTENVAPGSFDRHVSMMSLPYLFHSRPETIPQRLPFFRVPAEPEKQWADRCAALRGLKVGLVWGGNKITPRHAMRSLRLEKLAPLMMIPGIAWISLQKGDDAAQLRECGLPILDWMDECRDLLDTAALADNLDLVISVDTSVAHLAGGLGKPVWLLDRFESDWRWMLDREDSPWYPTLRIFRQPALHDWDSVVAKLAVELNILVSARSSRG